MRWLCLLVVLLVAPGCIHGQSTEDSLKARLVHQSLFLRGLWKNDKLQFDAAGQLKGSSPITSPMFSGMDIEKVEVKPDRLVLTGRRLAIVFINQLPQPREFGSTVHLDIAAPATGDYGVALDAVFASDWVGLAPASPDYWQQFLLHGPVQPYERRRSRPDVTAIQEPGKAPMKIGGSVQPPRILVSPNPEFSEYARSVKFGGTVLVYLEVDPSGQPTHLLVIRPLGAGLDEKAIAAVQKYRFEPAMQGDKPVRVEMNVEVNFQLF